MILQTDVIRKLGLFIFLAILIITFTILSDVFLTSNNFTNVIRRSSMTIITASIWTLLLIGGGMDVSVGGVMALSGCISAILAVIGVPLLLAFLIGVSVGGLIGALNGFLTSYLGINPIIVTIATMNVSRGLAFLSNGGKAIVTGLPEGFTVLGRGYLGPIPIPIIIMLFILFSSYFILNRVVWGRHICAIGGNVQAAELSGINVKKIYFILYLATGLAAGLSGIMVASRLASGQPRAGLGFEFDVITAVVLGGNSLRGGEGTILGTLLGVLIVSFLYNGLYLLGVGTFYQYIFMGIILILAVIIDTIVIRRH